MPSTTPQFLKYGLLWEQGTHPATIEQYMIQHGGVIKRGAKTYGLGLFHHFRTLQDALWPDIDHHRWSDLCLQTILDNTVTVIMGPKSSGKTFSAACYALCEYFCWPDETMILVSSTDLRGLELRVWGEIKSLFVRAKEQFPEFPGNIIESKHAISTDDVEDGEVRDLRKGIIGIPCIVGGRLVGLGKFAGIKQKRVIAIADEASFMAPSFLDGLSNLDSNPYFRAVIMGNPKDFTDSLGKSAEPKDGWTSIGEPQKTTTWKTRWKDGTCVNLVGTDSPNFDYPDTEPVKYRYLINRNSIASTASFYGTDSAQFYMMCKGVMKSGLIARRVITRELCNKFHAQDRAVWGSGQTIKIVGLDAAYGSIGGDRCMMVILEMGRDVNGKQIIKCYPPQLVPVSVNYNDLPEDQIARYVMNECVRLNIAPQNVFFDATGRGSLGTAFARLWSAAVNPVEFGGNPTDRPVSLDLFHFDPKERVRRLKKCIEHYSKFVTEMWFSARYAIESEQIKELADSIIDDGSAREWTIVRSDKIEIEPKSDTRERTGMSPDEFDSFVTALEGCRRRGFQISKLASPDADDGNLAWLGELRESAKAMRKRFTLTEA